MKRHILPIFGQFEYPKNFHNRFLTIHGTCNKAAKVMLTAIHTPTVSMFFHIHMMYIKLLTNRIKIVSFRYSFTSSPSNLLFSESIGLWTAKLRIEISKAISQLCPYGKNLTLYKHPANATQDKIMHNHTYFA